MMVYLKLMQHTKETITPLLGGCHHQKPVESTREVVTYHHEAKGQDSGFSRRISGFSLFAI